VVDIDLLLQKDQLELKLKGKTYVVTDVPLTDFLSTLQGEDTKDPEILRKQLASLLGAKVEDVADVGAKGLILSLGEIRKWLTGTVEAEKNSDKNPK